METMDVHPEIVALIEKREALMVAKGPVREIIQIESEVDEAILKYHLVPLALERVRNVFPSEDVLYYGMEVKGGDSLVFSVIFKLHPEKMLDSITTHHHVDIPHFSIYAPSEMAVVIEDFIQEKVIKRLEEGVQYGMVAWDRKVAEDPNRVRLWQLWSLPFEEREITHVENFDLKKTKGKLKRIQKYLLTGKIPNTEVFREALLMLVSGCMDDAIIRTFTPAQLTELFSNFMANNGNPSYFEDMERILGKAVIADHLKKGKKI